MANTVVVEEFANKVTVNETTNAVEVSAPGPQGAQGPVGPAGPAIPVFSLVGELSVLVGLHRFYVESAATLSLVRASVGVPATGSSVVIGYLINGVKAGEVVIAADEFTALESVAVPVAAGDYFTVDIEQVGSTFVGADLTVALTLE